MRPPHPLIVSKFLREHRLFSSPLNNVEVRKWEPKHRKEWERITAPDYKHSEPLDTSYAIEIPEAELYSNTPRPLIKYTGHIKVIRIKDGKMFESVSDCRRKEGFYKQKMEDYLKAGVHYKRI
jgi:hypothetical protein